MGFTSWNPEPSTVLLGVIAYAVLGAGIATFKWIDLVGKIKNFTENVSLVISDDRLVRCMAQEEFKPNNARDGCMIIPPDPYEFRTRLWLWFIYWPSFTLLRPLTAIHKRVAVFVWNLLCNLSKGIYDNRNYK